MTTRIKRYLIVFNMIQYLMVKIEEIIESWLLVVGCWLLVEKQIFLENRKSKIEQQGLKKLKHFVLFKHKLTLLNKMKKQHLPQKICLVCEKPFAWRKKWAKDWENVKYCSERCRRNKNNTHG